MHRKRLAGFSGKIAIAIALTALWAAPAVAAPPANDDFANRQVLAGSLPIEAPAENFEAGKETGESLDLFAAAGHSVWFEWEALATGWVTIGACSPAGEFKEVLGVYTGTTVAALTRVAKGNADEGPHCPFTQHEYSFKATIGTKYEIAVDGSLFGFPGQPPPVTEGTTALRIEATPPPANDDFAQATVLSAPIEEEPGGERFYYASANGYNWTATTEAGEPDEGTSRGASVWYAWTAPETATYHFGSLCCGTHLSWAAYRGDSVDALTPILLGAEVGEVFAVAGSTYRIVIDGDLDPDTGEPAKAGFGFSISASLPARLSGLTPSTGASASVGVPAADRVAPQTAIGKRKLGKRSAKFWFSANEAGVGFRCQLDARGATACGSPKAFGGLPPGRHVFKVYAIDAAGNADSSPAVARFKIPPLPNRHRD